jgi:hypothetical protein
MTAVSPQTRHIIRAQEVISAKRGNRITIRHPLEQVVCVIELVSPGNNSSRSALRSFVRRADRRWRCAAGYASVSGRR